MGLKLNIVNLNPKILAETLMKQKPNFVVRIIHLNKYKELIS